MSVQKSSNPKLARFSVTAPHPISKAEVYWAKATPAELTVEDVKNREWTALPANKGKENNYEATLPVEAADWFAVVSDERPVSVSGDLIHLEK